MINSHVVLYRSQSPRNMQRMANHTSSRVVCQQLHGHPDDLVLLCKYFRVHSIKYANNQLLNKLIVLYSQSIVKTSLAHKACLCISATCLYI